MPLRSQASDSYPANPMHRLMFYVLRFFGFFINEQTRRRTSQATSLSEKNPRINSMSKREVLQHPETSIHLQNVPRGWIANYRTMSLSTVPGATLPRMRYSDFFTDFEANIPGHTAIFAFTMLALQPKGRVSLEFVPVSIALLGLSDTVPDQHALTWSYWICAYCRASS
jgi:hypothetical protein